MIKVENIDKIYGKFKAVDNVSFHIGKGEIVGLLGPNGAGKTTIMKILTGYHYPTHGTAILNGYSIYDDLLKVKESTGYLPEMAPLYDDLTVMEYLDFMADIRKVPKSRKKAEIDRVIQETGLAPVINRSIGKLSKGYRQRTGLAQAIIHSPDILILDEPTTGLDPNQIIEIRKLICDIGKEKTVILSTHILQEVEAVCNRVLILNHGKIVAEGSPEQIRDQVQKDDRFTIEVAGTVDVQSLKALEPVTEILSAESKDGKTIIKISAQKGTDAGALIFDWAVKNGCRLSALIPEQTSLEDIFRKLTNQTEV
ncbi:MAG: ATP-binding cassette domain-containing protein [Spirochaetia bacterium]|jgi:ABC-2 type transport system ATP-binding protein|nr:ATP-binding cassette domain-containing protein [Spirochaetia bacterium]